MRKLVLDVLHSPRPVRLTQGAGVSPPAGVPISPNQSVRRTSALAIGRAPLEDKAAIATHLRTGSGRDRDSGDLRFEPGDDRGLVAVVRRQGLPELEEVTAEGVD